MRSSESRDDVFLYTGSKQHSGPDLQTKPCQYHKLQAKALPKSQAAAPQGLQRPTRCRQLQLPLAVVPQILQACHRPRSFRCFRQHRSYCEGASDETSPAPFANEGCWQKQLPVSNDGSFRPSLLQLALPLRGPPASDVDFRISRFSTGASQDQPAESHGLKSFVAFCPRSCKPVMPPTPLGSGCRVGFCHHPRSSWIPWGTCF